MPLDTSIAMGYKPPQMPNQLANYAQMQQIMGAQQSQEASQMQLEKMKRDEASLSTMMQAITAKGGPSDPMEAASAMIKSGIPHYMDAGLKLQQAAQQQKQFASIMGGVPAAAPEAGENALAPAAPANALAPKPDVAAMGAQRNQLLALGTPQGIAAARALDADIALASKEPVYHNVTGVGLVDPRNRQVVMPSVEKTPVVALTNLAKLQTELSALPPGDPRRAQYEAAIRKETQFAPQAVTNITNVQEKAESGAYGKMLVDHFGDLSKAANLAVKTLPSIESNLSALNKGLDTGFGTEAKAAGAKILGALGVQNAEKYATDTQTFQANAIQAVLQKQLEQKGPQTESDAQRIEQIGAQLGKTKAANEAILSVAKEQLRRDIDQRNFYADWRKKTGSFEGAENAWFAGEGSKSLFDRPALKSYSGALSATENTPKRPTLGSIFGSSSPAGGVPQGRK